MPQDWESEDGELDDDDLVDSGDAEELQDCPYCGKRIYEDAEQCPECGMYLDGADAPPQRRPLWITLGIALCLAVFLLWIFSGAMGFW